MYVFLIYEKSQSLNVFKSFKAEVENQLNKIIKKVKSDRGGEIKADMTVQVNNVRGLLPNTRRNVESSHSTPC